MDQSNPSHSSEPVSPAERSPSPTVSHPPQINQSFTPLGPTVSRPPQINRSFTPLGPTVFRPPQINQSFIPRGPKPSTDAANIASPARTPSHHARSPGRSAVETQSVAVVGNVYMALDEHGEVSRAGLIQEDEDEDSSKTVEESLSGKCGVVCQHERNSGLCPRTLSS